MLNTLEAIKVLKKVNFLKRHTAAKDAPLTIQKIKIIGTPISHIVAKKQGALGPAVPI